MNTSKKTKRLALILSKLGANKTLFWLWILEQGLDLFDIIIMYHIKASRKDRCVRIYFISPWASGGNPPPVGSIFEYTYCFEDLVVGVDVSDLKTQGTPVW